MLVLIMSLISSLLRDGLTDENEARAYHLLASVKASEELLRQHNGILSGLCMILPEFNISGRLKVVVDSLRLPILISFLGDDWEHGVAVEVNNYTKMVKKLNVSETNQRVFEDGHVKREASYTIHSANPVGNEPIYNDFWQLILNNKDGAAK